MSAPTDSARAALTDTSRRQARGDLQRNRELAEHAVATASDATVLVDALLALAAIEEQLADYNAAEAASARVAATAAALARTADNERRRIASLIALGNANRLQGRYADAERHLRDALARAASTCV
jgi:hypothetical protein